MTRSLDRLVRDRQSVAYPAHRQREGVLRARHADDMGAFALRHVVRLIGSGKPDQNAFIERFNRSYLTDVLNASLFE